MGNKIAEEAADVLEHAVDKMWDFITVAIVIIAEALTE